MASETVLTHTKNLIVRQNPSNKKIRYLMHLEDCRESAYKGVVHGLLVLDSISKLVDIQQMSQPLCHAGESFQSRLLSSPVLKSRKSSQRAAADPPEHLDSHTYIIYRASHIGLIAIVVY